MRAELMGHGPEINQSVYTKVIPESLRDAVANVASELFAVAELGELTVRCN
jgi:hypothetical protein